MLRGLRFLAAVEHVEAAKMPAAADIQVVRDRRDRDDAFLLTIFRAQRDARSHSIAWRRKAYLLAFQHDLAGARFHRTVDQLHQFGSARAHEAKETDNLTRARGKRCGLLETRSHQPLHLELHIA